MIENLRNSNPSSSSNPSSNPSFSSTSNLKSGCASGSEKVDKVGKVKSFSQYRKLKGSEWKKKVKGKEKDKADDVIIFIGLLQWRQLDRKLKPARGKRIALRVSNEAPYAELCTQALLKWKAYQSNIYDEEKEYSLVFEDGNEALFLPGTKEFFTLKRYKEETGKDYKRIVLYVCTKSDISRSEDFEDDDEDDDGDDNADDDSNDRCAEHSGKRARSQILNDEKVAMELQSQFNNEIDDNMNIFSDDLPLPMQSENIVGGQLDETDCLNEVQNDPAITGVEARIYESTAEIVERL